MAIKIIKEEENKTLAKHGLKAFNPSPLRCCSHLQRLAVFSSSLPHAAASFSSLRCQSKLQRDHHSLFTFTFAAHQNIGFGNPNSLFQAVACFLSITLIHIYAYVMEYRVCEWAFYVCLLQPFSNIL